MLPAARGRDRDLARLAQAHAGACKADGGRRPAGRSARMSTFLVNGIEKKLPISWEAPLGELIQYVQRNINNDQSLVTTYKINGLEISAAEEVTLGGIPLSSLNTVEIETV